MKRTLGKPISRRMFVKATAGAALISATGPFVLRHALAADPLVIGVVSPASGNYADHGMMERLGMTMAAEEYKEKGSWAGP
jgi:ABC-type branched-subunit amino acid transport system substrate-binding protein